jgi:hypothetical protein
VIGEALAAPAVPRLAHVLGHFVTLQQSAEPLLRVFSGCWGGRTSTALNSVISLIPNFLNTPEQLKHISVLYWHSGSLLSTFGLDTIFSIWIVQFQVLSE